MNQLFITTDHRAKMEGMVSLNTSTECNPFCKEMQKNSEFVCSHCYAHQMERMYGRKLGYIEKYKINGDILSNRNLTESELGWLTVELGTRSIVRFHSFGELLNMIHLNNFVRIAKALPKTIFALWSKRVDIIKRLKDKPKNLILIYSTPKLDDFESYIPKGFDKVFSVYKKKVVEKNNIEINCQGRCIDCLKCYSPKGPKQIREQMK